MSKDVNNDARRIVLRDLLSGGGMKGFGELGSLRAPRQRRVRVYDPEVKFISLSNSLHLRSQGR